MPLRELASAIILTAVAAPGKAPALIWWCLTGRILRARVRIRQHGPAAARRLLRRHDALRWMALRQVRDRATRAPAGDRTRFLLVLRVGAEAARIERTLAGIAAQSHDGWQVLLLADGECPRAVRRWIDDRPGRVTLARLPASSSLAGAVDAALLASGADFVAMLDGSVTLLGDCLTSLARAARAAGGDAAVLYCDTCYLDRRGVPLDIHFKPDWNEELFLAQNYLDRPVFFSAAAFRGLGGFRPDLPGAEEFDLILRQAAAAPRGIRHIPDVLATRTVGSLADIGPEKGLPGAAEAVAGYLAAKGQPAVVEAGPAGFRRVRRRLPDPPPRVAIVIPTRDRLDLLRPCIDSILARTAYPRFRVVIADNDSRDPATHAWFAGFADDPRFTVVRCPGPFNFARINNEAVARLDDDILVFLNNDTEVVSPSWLADLAAEAARADVGAVGAKLLYPSGRIQHAGMLLGGEHLARHAHLHDADGYETPFWRGHLAQHASAVTGACLAVRREAFAAVAGFDEKYAVFYNDVDLCLKLSARLGLTNIYLPSAVLIHKEGQSVKTDADAVRRAAEEADRDAMAADWGSRVATDPWFNPNLRPDSTDFEPML